MRRSHTSYAVSVAAAILASPGCFVDDPMPDQTVFAPLSEVAESGLAMARVYAAPIPPIEPIAVHCWFVIKSADSQSIERWEVFETPTGTYGYVFLNGLEPTADVGAGGTFVVAELTGPQADPIVEFIRSASPDYPCKDVYVVFPGPNSNSYVQWVLDNTSWDVTLPARAIGKAVEPNCP